MDPLQETFRCQLSQITPDGVFGQIEFMTQGFGYHLPVSAQKVQDFLFALTGEHRNTIARGKYLHDITRNCTNYREWFMMANRSKVMTESKPLIILIAGPYRSGTNDDRTLIDGNGGMPVQDSVVVIQGNRITSVSRKGQTAAYPANAWRKFLRSAKQL